ncbi:MAG: mitochondrial fission ELM1 family protein [Holosporaceae bacterium]|jgi:mitochondrial fission protein ELM1|nr:mitochondrial fission ELM1 family protein [Holosporaceae bacterium]
MAVCIWSLEDGKVGSSKQAGSLARALDSAAVTKKIVYTPLIGIPNLIRPLWVGIDFKNSDNIVSVAAEEVPEVLVFAGRRSAGAALFLKKYFLSKFGKKVKLIAILNPNYNFKHFDLVILPMHDVASGKGKTGGNVMYINGSLCNAILPPLDSVEDYWNNELNGSEEPFFSLMVGGDTKNSRIDPVKFGIILEKISGYVIGRNGTLLVSTSRRTSFACLEEIKEHLRCHHHLYEWSVDSHIPNPYYLFIKRSSMVFLTGDSISMVSEVATIGKPIYVYMPSELSGKKHIRFLKNLVESGIAREIEADTNTIEKFGSSETLNELDRVSRFVKNNILNNANYVNTI